MENNKKLIFLKSTMFILGILLIAILMLFFIKSFVAYPLGADVYGYLFRVRTLYESLKQGDLYPIYTNLWYNGTELFRSWSPFVYYICAFFTWIFNGEVFSSYYALLVLCFVLSSIGFLCFGVRDNRVGLAFILSILYFFLPDNLRVMFSEGNFIRSFITGLTPLLIFNVDNFLRYRKKRALVYISIIMIIITCSHFMIAAMYGVAIFIYCLFECFLNKNFKDKVILIFDIGFSYLASGLVLVPGVFGGVLGLSRSVDSELAMWTEDFSVSLNYFLRFEPDGLGLFYFGNILILFSILAIICKKKNNVSYFYAGVLIFLLTSSELIPFLKLLPFSQVFWMKRLAPIAYVFLFVGILNWKELKKRIIFILSILLIIDLIPSLGFFKYEKDLDGLYNSNVVEEHIEEVCDKYLITDAIDICNNTLAVIDESAFGCIPSYYISTKNSEINFINGWGLQGAKTRQLIVNINEAYQNGYYYYSFDRLKELGADVIVFKKSFFNGDLEEFKQIGKELGYDFIKENENAFLFKLNCDIEGHFGTINNYKNIAIGTSGYFIQYLYPDFETGNSIYVDDYSYDELIKFERIYLAGFNYHNKEKAEYLLKELARDGVKIVIDMSHIPTDLSTGKNSIFNVYAQEINFNASFPVIEVDGSQFKLPFQSDRYETWKTYYLEGDIKKIQSSLYFTYPELIYWGVDKETENINFLGFNLIYYCVENKTYELLYLFNKMFDLNNNIVPERVLVPINIEYNLLNDNICINSNYDNVNTNLAYLDCFSSFRELENEENLLVVNKGETNINIKYPMFKISFICSIIGIVSLMTLWVLTLFIYKNKKKK